MPSAVENPLPRSHVETVSRILSIVLLIAGGCYGVGVYLGSDPGVSTGFQERFAQNPVAVRPGTDQTSTQPPLIGTRTKGHLAPAGGVGGNPVAQIRPGQQAATVVPAQDTLPAASADPVPEGREQQAASAPAPIMQ